MKYSDFEYSVLSYIIEKRRILLIVKSIYTDDYINIISTLRAIRINKNITQVEMAKLLNVTQSFVSKVENRERRLDVVELLTWIDVLGVSAEDVLPKKYLGGND